MLYVSVGDYTEDCIRRTSAFFDFNKKPEWFEDEFVRHTIRTIDRSEVIMGECIVSPVLGAIAPERLSSGCKGVILLRMLPERSIYATRCGDNCFPLIQELSKMQDVKILLHNCPKMPVDIEATFVESGKEVHNRREFVEEYYRLRHQYTGV